MAEQQNHQQEVNQNSQPQSKSPESTPTKKKWYDIKPLVIVLLFLFFPVGLYALWKSSQFKKVTKVVVTAIVVLVICMCDSDEPATSNEQVYSQQKDSSANTEVAETTPSEIPTATSDNEELVMTQLVDKEKLENEIAVAKASEHKIRLMRRGEVGDEYGISAVNTFSIPGRSSQNFGGILEFDAIVEILEVDDQKRITKAACLVERCETIYPEERDIFTEKVIRATSATTIFSPGTILIASTLLDAPRDSFATRQFYKQYERFPTSGDKEADEVFISLANQLAGDTPKNRDGWNFQIERYQDALRDIIKIYTKGSDLDDFYGTLENKKVGDSWPISTKVISESWKNTGLNINESKISGSFKLSDVRKVKEKACLHIEGNCKIQNSLLSEELQENGLIFLRLKQYDKKYSLDITVGGEIIKETINLLDERHYTGRDRNDEINIWERDTKAEKYVVISYRTKEDIERARQEAHKREQVAEKARIKRQKEVQAAEEVFQAKVKKIRDSRNPFSKIDSMELALAVYPPEYTQMTSLLQIENLNETKGKYIYAPTAYVFQALGPGECMMRPYQGDSSTIIRGIVNNPKFEDYAFRDDSHVQQLLCRSLGVTTYKTAIGSSRQALLVEILYIGY